MQTLEASFPDVFQKPHPLGEFTKFEEKAKETQVLREETEYSGRAGRRNGLPPKILKIFSGLGEEVRKPYFS